MLAAQRARSPTASGACRRRPSARRRTCRRDSDNSKKRGGVEAGRQ